VYACSIYMYSNMWVYSNMCVHIIEYYRTIRTVVKLSLLSERKDALILCASCILHCKLFSDKRHVHYIMLVESQQWRCCCEAVNCGIVVLTSVAQCL
jgi:hypothetical protein